MPNPYRVAIRWVCGPELFPNLLLQRYDEVPQRYPGTGSLYSVWHIQSDGLTSAKLADFLDSLKAETIVYTDTQLKALANQIRSKSPKVEEFVKGGYAPANPWNAVRDPWYDDGFVFYGELHTDTGKISLPLWLTPLDVVEV